MDLTGRVLIRHCPSSKHVSMSLEVAGKVINLNRDASENTDKLLNRLKLNYQRTKDGGKKSVNSKRKKHGIGQMNAANEADNSMEAFFMGPSESRLPSSSLGEAVDCAKWLKIGDTQLSVVLNPCHVTNIQLNTPLYVGWPVLPEVEVEGLQTQKGEVKYLWGHSDEKTAPSRTSRKKHVDMIDSEDEAENAAPMPTTQADAPSPSVLHEGKFFIPQERDVGKFLRVCGFHESSEELGFVLEKSLNPVKKSPTQGTWRDSRMEAFNRFLKRRGNLRVGSFNLLAPYYTRTRLAKQVMYTHLPSQQYLDWSYRLPLLLREIMEVDADLLCLQEVEKSFYELQLSPFLEKVGYAGQLHLKTGRAPEGCAILVKKERFQILHIEKLELKDEAILQGLSPLSMDEFSKAPWWPKLRDNVLPKLAMIAPISFVRDVTSKSFYLIASLHLFFHPKAAHVRLLQLNAITARLEKLKRILEQANLEEASQEDIQRLIEEGDRGSGKEREGEGEKRQSVSVLIAGDFNSCQKSSPYRFLKAKKIKNSDFSWLNAPNFITWTKEEEEDLVDEEETSPQGEEGGATLAEKPQQCVKEAEETQGSPSKKSRLYSHSSEVNLDEFDLGEFDEASLAALQKGLLSPSALRGAHLSHSLPLRPVEWEEGTVTNAIACFRAPLDHIFYSEDLELQNVLGGLKGEEVDQYGGLPCEVYGSDHVMVAADFAPSA